MRNVIFICILILSFGCSQTKKENDGKINQPEGLLELNSLKKDAIEEKLVVKAHIGDDSRIDIELALEDKNNNYLASFNNAELSICCYQLLDISNHIEYGKCTKTVEKYESENNIELVDLYVFENSFVKKYYNKHPEVMHEDLICGRIVDNDLIPNSRIKIGMSKSSLLELFLQPTEFFEQISILTIYENELGESHTSYRCDNEKLIEIVFDSDYDWIDKERNKK